MKNFIALDTSGEYLTVIAKKGENTRVVFEENCAMQHSVRLMDAIEEAAGAVGLAPAECDFFCAAVGPGSFTGIRIGISAVKGLCAATGKPSLGVTTFAALAYNAEEKALAVIPPGGAITMCAGSAGIRALCTRPPSWAKMFCANLQKNTPCMPTRRCPCLTVGQIRQRDFWRRRRAQRKKISARSRRFT